MDDHVSQLEYQLAKLMAMGKTFEEDIKVAHSFFIGQQQQICSFDSFHEQPSREYDNMERCHQTFYGAK